MQYVQCALLRLVPLARWPALVPTLPQRTEVDGGRGDRGNEYVRWW